MGTQFFGLVTVNVTPSWWRVAEPRMHWMRVNESVFSWEHPMRSTIGGIHYSFRALEVEVFLTNEQSAEDIRHGASELLRRLEALPLK